MGIHIKVSNVIKQETVLYQKAENVVKPAVNGYIRIDNVNRLFYPDKASPITNFAKVSKNYNNIYFSWKNPSYNYTGVVIRA